MFLNRFPSKFRQYRKAPDLSPSFYVQAVLDSSRLFCHNVIYDRKAASTYIDIRGNRWGAVFAKILASFTSTKIPRFVLVNFLKKERKKIANVKSWIPLFLASLYDSTLYFATTRRIGYIKNNEVKDLRLIRSGKTHRLHGGAFTRLFLYWHAEGLYEYNRQQHELRKINVLDTINIRTLHWEKFQ